MAAAESNVARPNREADDLDDVTHVPRPRVGGTGFTELVLTDRRVELAADEVEVRLPDGASVRFRGGCDIAAITRIIAALGESAS